MTHPNSLPKYIQISEFLIRDISAGRLQDGQRLPPERQMAEELRTSVGTLRKSLSDLEEKGLISRVQGSGNYIQHSEETDSVYRMFRLEALGGGGLPRARLISLEHLEKPADLPLFGTSTHATRIRRQRYLNDVSIAAEEIWLDGSAGVIDAKSMTESLYQTYRDQLGLWITRAEDRVSHAPLPDWADGEIHASLGTTMGYIERRSWGEPPEAVEFSRTWFDTARAVYVQRLK